MKKKYNYKYIHTFGEEAVSSDFPSLSPMLRLKYIFLYDNFYLRANCNGIAIHKHICVNL